MSSFQDLGFFVHNNPKLRTCREKIMLVAPWGFCLRVIDYCERKPQNLEKTTTSVLSALLLIYNLAELKLICYGCQELTKYWLCARNIPGIVNNHEKCIYFNLVLLSLLFRSTQFIQQGFYGASRPSSFTTFNFEFICEHFLFVQNTKKNINLKFS